MSFIYDRKKTALVYQEKEYSYFDLIRMAKIYSSFLEIEREDRVVIFMENRPEYVGAVLGVWDSKGACTNLDVTYNVEQLAYVFKDSYPKYIFTSNKNIEIVKKAKDEAQTDIIILNIDEIDLSVPFEIDNSVIDDLEEEQLAVMLYTSGTTGMPKGVMLTYSNIMSNINDIDNMRFVFESDVALAMLPFHHALPFVLGMLMPLRFGVKNVILDELSSDSIKHHLQKYKITVVIGIPRIWEMFHKGIMGKINSSSVARNLFKVCKKLNITALNKVVFKKIQLAFGGNIRFLISGGAKLDKEISEDFKVFGIEIIEGYGLTETSPIISFNPLSNNKRGSVGVPLASVQVKIDDNKEILVKGPNVMKGYFNKPEATAEVIDSEGWFHTGDLGEFDGEHLKIIGRKKEMIVLSNGKNINPGDIEAQIMKGTKLIEEIAIIEKDKHLVAVVYPKFKTLEAQGIANAKDAIKWEVVDQYNINAPAYRRILDVIIVKEELPKTKLGKLRRFMLNDFLKNQNSSNSKENLKKQSNSKEIYSSEFKEIERFLKTLHNELNIIPESHLEIDLGLDSLDLVELISFIETTYGIQISEQDFSKIKTIEELILFIREKGGVFENQEINWKNIFSEPVDVNLPTSRYIGIAKFILLPFFKFYIKLSKKIDKLSKDKPVIYVGNHQSMLDVVAFQQAMPYSALKESYFIAIDIHFKKGIKKHFADNSNVILINKNKNLKETLKIAAHILKLGKNLVIFPEGARTRDGKLQEFKKTFAILSKELNIPIVPFVIDGAYNLMPYGTDFPKSGEFSIEFLEPIFPEDKTVEEIVKTSYEKIAEKLN